MTLEIHSMEESVSLKELYLTFGIKPKQTKTCIHKNKTGVVVSSYICKEDLGILNTKKALYGSTSKYRCMKGHCPYRWH